MLLAANSAKSEGCPWILGEILPHFRFLSSSHCTEKNKLESDNKTSTCNKISNAVGQNSNAVAQIPSRAPLIRSHLIRSRHIWSGKDTLDPVKTYLIRSHMIRSHLIRHIWSCIISRDCNWEIKWRVFTRGKVVKLFISTEGKARTWEIFH